MIRETYKGRALKVAKDRNGGLVGSINGQPMPAVYSRDGQAVIDQFHRDIDLVDQAPVDGGRWGAYMYAPGTYELCEEGLHPRAIGEPCRHSYCQRAAAKGPDMSGSLSLPDFTPVALVASGDGMNEIWLAGPAGKGN